MFKAQIVVLNLSGDPLAKCKKKFIGPRRFISSENETNFLKKETIENFTEVLLEVILLKTSNPFRCLQKQYNNSNSSLKKFHWPIKLD